MYYVKLQRLGSTFPPLSVVEVSQQLYEQEESGGRKWWICFQNGSFSADAVYPDPRFHRNVKLSICTLSL